MSVLLVKQVNKLAVSLKFCVLFIFCGVLRVVIFCSDFYFFKCMFHGGGGDSWYFLVEVSFLERRFLV